MKNWALLALLGLLFVSACKRETPTVRIQTEMGTIRVRLYDTTPRHRDNFLKLVKAGFYDSLLFHRVIRGFMIQGGDPDSKYAPAGKRLGNGTPGYDLSPEIKASPVRGALAAARFPDAYNPDRESNGAQFFFVQGKPQTEESLRVWEQQRNLQFSPEQRKLYKEKGGAPQLEGQYTVFGEIIEGLEVLDQIAAVQRDHNDRPLHDIRMIVTIE